jgi:hypothetical protein
MKRGAVWEFWIFGMVAGFIGILVYFTMTPFLNRLISDASTIGNFTTTTVNTSFHNTLTYVSNLWDLWPIAILAIVFLLFFIASSEEEKLETTGRF